MTDRADTGPADPDQHYSYNQLTVWNVEGMPRFDTPATRPSYNLPLANALIEFDPFYSPPAQDTKADAQGAVAPIVNLPPPRPASTQRAKLFPVNKGDDKVKGFTRPRGSLALEQPKFQIPPTLLQDKDMYAVLPVHLRGPTQQEVPVQGGFNAMMQALDQTRKELVTQAKSVPSPADIDAKHPVPAPDLPVTPVKQVSQFGATTSKVATPQRDWIGSSPEMLPVPSAQPLSFVTPKTERNLPPRMQLPDTPESPLAKKSLREDNLQYDNAAEVMKQTLEGKGVPAGSTKYLLITGVSKTLDPVIMRERIARIADVKALVHRYQGPLGAIVVLLHSTKDASKVDAAISRGELDLESQAKASRFNLGLRAVDADQSNRAWEAVCYGIAAGAVLQFAGKAVMKYINDCEACLRITLKTGGAEGSAQFLQTLLEEVGPLRLFVPDQANTHTFLTSFDDIRDNRFVSEQLSSLALEGYTFAVSEYPTARSDSLVQTSKPVSQFIAPMTPPDSGRKRLAALPSPAQAAESNSPTPWRPSFKPVLPVTPPRNVALERMLQDSTPRTDLLSAIRKERSKWDMYERALISTPLSRNTLQLFRTAQDGIASSGSPPTQVPLPASKLVSFNSMKSPNNVKVRDWFAAGLKGEKGQDSIRYKQEVPQEYRFSLERLQRGLDTRTTVMIKDIPNKLTRNQLIEAIQEVVPGGITFVYLRFDWEFQCNVAYGFVNFRTLNHLEAFARHRLGQKWGLYMSDKVLQMSYATIQGHDMLVNHFRNSTVMHATPEWRPVVINTAGNIDHFPPPNREANGQYGFQNGQRPNRETYEWEETDPHTL